MIKDIQHDVKEEKLLAHYKAVLNALSFDEYDVLGFLIIVRHRLLATQYPYIKDFAHLVAHRFRERGIIMDCISAAIDNQYATVPRGKAVVGYHGIDMQKWECEWENLCSELQITYSKQLLKEITLCVFSLSQFTEYNDGKNHAGKIMLLQGHPGSLAMCTTEGHPTSLYICFAIIDDINFCRTYAAGCLVDPVEAVRIDGVLRLQNNDGFIL